VLRTARSKAARNSAFFACLARRGRWSKSSPSHPFANSKCIRITAIMQVQHGVIVLESQLRHHDCASPAVDHKTSWKCVRQWGGWNHCSVWRGCSVGAGGEGLKSKRLNCAQDGRCKEKRRRLM
jgi:hypothetical protein